MKNVDHCHMMNPLCPCFSYRFACLPFLKKFDESDPGCVDVKDVKCGGGMGEASLAVCTCCPYSKYDKVDRDAVFGDDMANSVKTGLAPPIEFVITPAPQACCVTCACAVLVNQPGCRWVKVSEEGQIDTGIAK